MKGEKKQYRGWSLLKNLYINNSTVDYSGCGAVSLYNTIKILDPNTEITFPQVIYWMEPYGVLNNSLGALPTEPGDILEKLGYEVTYSCSHDPAEIAQKASQADAAISYYMTPEYFHFVAFQSAPPDPDSGQLRFEFYNEQNEQGDIVIPIWAIWSMKLNIQQGISLIRTGIG